MSADLRHARRVRLAARQPELVRRGALLLEDALRTASLPGAGPGRVLVFRRLAVGTILANAPPSRLALMIEQQVRQLVASAVYAEEASAPVRESVFFLDDAEPPALLARRLARGEATGAWFWPLAVPGFHPLLPREEALRLMVRAALETAAGPGALVHLVETLHEARALEPVLSALRWQDGPELLRAWRGEVPESATLVPAVLAARAGEALEPGAGGTALLRPSLRAVVEPWVTAWSPGDARSVWLCAVALCVERRERLADPRLFARAARLAAGLGAMASGRPGNREVPPGQSPERSRRHPEKSAAPHEVHPREPDSTASPRSPVVDERAADVPPPMPTGDRRVDAEAPATARPPRAPGSAPEDTRAGSEAATPAPPRRPSVPSTSREEARLAHEEPRAHEARPVDTRAVPVEEPTGPETAPGAHAPWPEVPSPTAVGGLLFLVPLLERLGVATLLEEHPALLELGLADRLLASVARRLGAPEEDPALAIFGAAPTVVPGRCPFSLPERLRTQVAATGDLRISRLGERTVRVDASGRLPLAVDYGEPGEPLEPERLWPAPREEDDLALLLRALTTALRRACRRKARLGLGELVRRPARLVATRTHVDVLFDPRAVDLRVRRAGLDLDPGWVPWLGRVVRFHYLHGEP